jgi:hypothetical protein
MPIYQVHLSGSPQVDLDGLTWRTDDPAALALYAHSAILNAATARVRSHFLFHAAALAAPDGAGVILASRAGLGKTTLALALLTCGYRLYSDDLAAVGCADGLLYPFPRSLGVRDAGCRPGEKRWLDLAEFGPAALPVRAPSAPRLLFLLTDETEPSQSADRVIVLSRISEPFLAELTELRGVEAIATPAANPYPTVVVHLVGGNQEAFEPAVQALCRRHAILLFDVAQSASAPPDFDQSPGLVRLSPAEATAGLLRHLKGGPMSALLMERFGGSAGRLYLALAGLTSGMTCYRLNVGQLDAAVTLIRDAVAQDAVSLRSEGTGA